MIKYEEIPESLRAKIEDQAKRCGVTTDEMLTHLDDITSGRIPKTLGLLKGTEEAPSASKDVPDVSFKDADGAVTIVITGKVYENLRRIAETMNGIGWTDDDNSPATVADFWVGSLLSRLAYAPGEAPCDVTDLTNDITDGIDTGAADGSAEDTARRAEIREAFRRIKW